MFEIQFCGALILSLFTLGEKGGLPLSGNAFMKLENPKLLDIDTAVAQRVALRSEGKKVVLTNGVFDLLHVGHIHALSEAAKQGDFLFVALNSDKSVRALKGEARPIFDQEHRALMLSALESVDAIILFDELRLTKEIDAIKPDVYVKSGDYTMDTLDKDERIALERVGAEIEFVPYLEGFSTSELIEKILRISE